MQQQQWRPPFIGAGIHLYDTKSVNNYMMYVWFISFTISFYTVQYIVNGAHVHRLTSIERVLILIAASCLVALTAVALLMYMRHVRLSMTIALIAMSLLLAHYVQAERIEIEMSLYPGAAAIYDQVTPRAAVSFYQKYEDVLMDRPSFYKYDECQAMYLLEVRKCSYGNVKNPDYVLALVAGSHSAHWFPALEPLAKEMNFRLDIYNHDGCRFTDADPDGHLTPQCVEWNANLLEVLKDNPPDLVFTTSTLNKRDQVPEGFIGQWKKLEGVTTIFAIRDTPRMDEDVPQCLQQHDGDIDACSMPRDEVLSRVVPWENTAGLPSNVIYADLSDYFCDDTTCYPVIGNMMVYRDQHHLTASYVETLAPVLKPYLEDAFAEAKRR